MFDTPVTIVGNVITAPEWRRTNVTNALVANFKVASSSRRFDKETGRWVDRPSLRVRVTCWRRLAEGVASSVMVGDPVVVTGRMYTRDWTADDGTKRASYELEAFAVGHDLARGRGTFTRHRGSTATSTVENAESDGRIAGEPSAAVEAPAPAPEEYNDLFDDFGDGAPDAAPSAEENAIEVRRGSGTDEGLDDGSDHATDAPPDQGVVPPIDGRDREAPAPGERMGPTEAELSAADPGATHGEPASTAGRGERPRRGRSRVPVPA